MGRPWSPKKTPIKKKTNDGRTRGPHFGHRRGTGGQPGGNRPRAGRRSLPVVPPLLADGAVRTHKAWLAGKKLATKKKDEVENKN